LPRPPRPSPFPYTTLFRSDERHAALLADVVDRHDVGMIDARRGARFPLESPSQLLLLGEVGAQHLDRDRSSQAQVGGLADFAHSDRKSTRLNSSHLGISYA